MGGGLLTYAATFVLGLLHALEPGHGKSILAAFSLRQTNFKVFVALLSSLFVSHFLVLGLFALGLQLLASAEAVENNIGYLQWATPILLIGYGGYLWYNGRKNRHKEDACSCGHHHHDHDNIFVYKPQDNQHSNVLLHKPQEQHNHNESTSTRTATITGFIAGLMPCPTAIAPLILSGMEHGFSSALLHILIYVIGMTIALLSFTGALVLLKSVFQQKMKRLEHKLNFNLLSSLIMIVVGLVYLVTNIMSSHSGHTHY